jgi:hypothetical protein
MNLNDNFRLKTIWRLWAKAIGEKAHKKDHVADKVAVLRTIIFATYLLTNCFIVAGVIRHWNDRDIKVDVEIYEAQPTVPMIQTSVNRTGQFE